MAAGPALFVEVEIDAVAGIAGLSGPDLNAGARVAREDRGGVTLVVGAIDEVGLVERAMAFVGHALGLLVGGGRRRRGVRRGEGTRWPSSTR